MSNFIDNYIKGISKDPTKSERVVSSIITPFLCKALGSLLSQNYEQYVMISPEFPIQSIERYLDGEIPSNMKNENNRSNRADFVLYDRILKKIIFIELKINSSKRDDEQKQMYLSIIDTIKRNKSAKFLHDFILKREENAERVYRNKYTRLLSEIRKIGIDFNEIIDAEVIYILPQKSIAKYNDIEKKISFCQLLEDVVEKDYDDLWKYICINLCEIYEDYTENNLKQEIKVSLKDDRRFLKRFLEEYIVKYYSFPWINMELTIGNTISGYIDKVLEQYYKNNNHDREIIFLQSEFEYYKNLRADFALFDCKNNEVILVELKTDNNKKIDKHNSQLEDYVSFCQNINRNQISWDFIISGKLNNITERRILNDGLRDKFNSSTKCVLLYIVPYETINLKLHYENVQFISFSDIAKVILTGEHEDWNIIKEYLTILDMSENTLMYPINKIDEKLKDMINNAKINGKGIENIEVVSRLLLSIYTRLTQDYIDKNPINIWVSKKKNSQVLNYKVYFDNNEYIAFYNSGKERGKSNYEDKEKCEGNYFMKPFDWNELCDAIN